MFKTMRSTLRHSELVGGFGAVTCTILLYSASVRLDLIGKLYRASRTHTVWPTDQIVILFVCLSFAFLFLTVRRSKQLASEIQRRERAERHANVLARNDALTGLSNRRVLAEELEKAIARSRRGATACAVLLIDLDRFKPVNDLHGHAVGDMVLCDISTRLKKIVRNPDSIARIGGDEFAVLVEYNIGSDTPLRLAQRLIAAASEPVSTGKGTLEIGATVGISACPADGVDAETLLHAADVALYRAKREERGTARFFEPSMDVELRTRAALEADLRRAISTGEIKPYFQPFFDLNEQALLGFEVLARWEHPTKGPLMPDLFIPVAEDAGLIGDLTATILRQACRAARDWPQQLILAVNISPQQLQDRWLPQRLLAILTETGFQAGRLEVEITENALVADIETARSVLTALQNVGIRVALDDFGTGYSSLYHLRELKFDKIKIDRSFVLTMKENGESEKIVSAILGLSKSLGLTTTAEGIETIDALDQLTDMGCDFGQGYHFGAAMPSEMAADLAFGRREHDGLLLRERADGAPPAAAQYLTLQP